MKYYDEYCKKIYDLLLDEDIKENMIIKNMSKKIRQSNIMKNSITIIIGDKERDNNLISYRKYMKKLIQCLLMSL